MSDNDMPDAALDAAPSDVEDYTSFAPLEVGQSKSLTGEDEGVVKKLLAEGEGYLQPEKGDEVFGACSESPSASASGSSRACARSALRGHAAGRHHVRQQPRTRRAVQVHARHGCVAEAGGRCSRRPPALATALADCSPRRLAGSVIKGWDVGVATMKKGEKAQLTCKCVRRLESASRQCRRSRQRLLGRCPQSGRPH